MDTHEECQVGKQRTMDKALLYEEKSGQRYKRSNYVKIRSSTILVKTSRKNNDNMVHK